MKKITLLLIVLASCSLSAQVGIGTTSPSASALLDVYSISSGFLMPRLSLEQRTGIVSPAAGLQVYGTDTNTIWYFNGTTWINMGAGTATTVSNTITGGILTTTVNNVTGTGVALPGATASNGLYVAASGDVKLGTTPLSEPTVISGLSAANTLKFQAASANAAAITVGTTTNTSGGLYLGNTGYGITRGFPTLGTGNNLGLYTTAANLYLSANGAATGQFELNTAGKATIGATATPGKLEVIGNGNGGNTSSILSTGPGFAPVGFKVTNGTVNENLWDMGASTTSTFQLRAVNDANNAASIAMLVNRTGAVVDNVIFPTGNVGIGNVTPNAPLQFINSTASNRKIVLYENANNEHQFYGFGIDPNILRYQIPVATSATAHVFYAGNGTSASNELMRITGNGYVGIGTAAPSNTLHVKGGIRYETPTAPSAGMVLTASNTSGDVVWQTPAGLNTYWGLTGNSGIVDGTNFIGTTDNVPFTIRINNTQAGRLENASGNAFYGHQAGLVNTGTLNTGIGSRAMIRNTSGIHNTAIGAEALFWNVSGDGNTGLGKQALLNTIGDYNTGLGYQAMGNNTNGSYNIAIGAFAGPSAAAFNITKATAIGYNATVTQSNSMVLGGTGVDAVNVGIGTTAPNAQLHTTGTIRFAGSGAALNKVLTTFDAAGLATWQSPAAALSTVMSGDATMTNAGVLTISNDAVGSAEITNSTIVNADLSNVSTGVGGIYKGSGSLSGNTTVTQGANTIAFNGSAVNAFAVDGFTFSVDAANGRIGVGTSTPVTKVDVLGTVRATGTSSFQAFMNTTNSGYLEFWRTSQAARDGYIGYGEGNGGINLSSEVSTKAIRLTTVNGDITLSPGTGNVGIGTTTPTGTAKLQVVGTVKISGGTPAIGKVLTSTDTLGNSTWQAPAGLDTYWGLLGNAGTVDGTNFIGTTDDVPFTIKINNTLAGRLENATLNAFYGIRAGTANTGYYNTGIGGFTMLNNTTGGLNVGVGAFAMRFNSTGGSNTAVGYEALYYTLTGSHNTALGNLALEINSTGTGNTAIGSLAGPLTNNLTNTTAIGFNAKVSASSSLVLGGTGADAVKVGIGTTSPTSKLHVVGLPVYTSDANAAAAGLTTGAFYQDAAGFVKVRQ